MSLPNSTTVDPAVDRNFRDLDKRTEGNEGRLTTAEAFATAQAGTYKTLLTASFAFVNDSVAGTYFLIPAANSATRAASPTGVSEGVPTIYLDNAYYTIAGTTPKLRVIGSVTTNGTSAGITFTFGLHAFTSAGAADVLTLTAAAASGTTAAVASPIANATGTTVGADFDFPADGAYTLCCATSGTLTNNLRAMVFAQLQTRNV